MQIQPLWGTSKIREIFGGVSEPTIHRWIRAAKQGRNNFPHPIQIGGADGGKKGKLFWNPVDIERFIQSQSMPQPQITPTGSKQGVKKAKVLQQQKEITQQRLAQHGIHINNEKGEK